MSTTLAFSVSVGMSSFFHQWFSRSAIASQQSSSISLNSSIGISSGPGDFLLLYLLMVFQISSTVISPIMYCISVYLADYIFLVLFIGGAIPASSPSFFLFFPHCSLLKYSAAFCALCFRVMCSPSAVLLAYGFGWYSCLSCLIPIHLSLMSKSLSSVFMIMFVLFSLLLFLDLLSNSLYAFTFCFNSAFSLLN